MSGTFVAPLSVEFSAPVEQQAVARGGKHQTHISFNPPPVLQLAIRRGDSLDELEEEFDE